MKDYFLPFTAIGPEVNKVLTTLLCRHPLAPTTKNMSSQLVNMVPLLDGTNFLLWNQQITAYLKSQGLWRTLIKTCPTQGPDPKDPDMSAEIEKWEDVNSKAIGSMNLCLHFTIAYKHRATAFAATLLADLTAEYGKPGVSGIFLEFKKLNDLRLPENQDPSIALDQFIGHISCLTEMKVIIPVELQGLLLLSKIPPSMSHLVQQFSQVDKVKDVMAFHFLLF